jgi:hypothetical protein
MLAGVNEYGLGQPGVGAEGAQQRRHFHVIRARPDHAQNDAERISYAPHHRDSFFPAAAERAFVALITWRSSEMVVVMAFSTRAMRRSSLMTSAAPTTTVD